LGPPPVSGDRSGHVNKVRGEHSPVFEANASDVAPLKSLIPFSVEVRENTNPHVRIVELHAENVFETLPGA